MTVEIWVSVLGAFGAVLFNGIWMTWILANRHAAAEVRLQGKLSESETRLHEKLVTMDRTLSEKLVTMDMTLREKMEGNYNLAITKLEAVGEREAKGRHDLANELQRQVGMLVLDDKAISQRLNDLAADVVRKSDLAAVEARMMAFLQKLDGKFDEIMRGEHSRN